MSEIEWPWKCMMSVNTQAVFLIDFLFCFTFEDTREVSQKCNITEEIIELDREQNYLDHCEL